MGSKSIESVEDTACLGGLKLTRAPGAASETLPPPVSWMLPVGVDACDDRALSDPPKPGRMRGEARPDADGKPFAAASASLAFQKRPDADESR
jgi:hypothetical protein